MLLRLLIVALEWVAIVDLLTDLQIVRMLWKSNLTISLTVTVISMLAPFYVSYVPFLMSLKERINRSSEPDLNLTTVAFIMASPLAIFMLLVIDNVFILNTAFLEVAFKIISFLSYGVIDLNYISEAVDNWYEILFGMKREDIEGFRRMRTTHQLLFETIIQLGLQVCLLYCFG